MLEWLKKWWWAIVGAILAVLGFILGISLKKAPIITGENPEKKAAEDEAAKKAQEAAAERDVKQKDAKDAHAEGEKKLLDSQEKLTKELESDPDATNDFLKKAGQDARGP
jgi:flagellar biosynthesis/type III secretory pathway M-ring protein FliF/YscJ